MSHIQVVLYRDEDGSVPFLDWFGDLPEKAQDKCRVRLERLAALGHELRRPEADYLRDNIYELRCGFEPQLPDAVFLPRSVHGRALAWRGQGRSGSPERDRPRGRAETPVRP
jgi:hypothetical protein